MKTATAAFQKNMKILLAVYGNFSRMARGIDMDPRHIRRARGLPSKKLRARIASEAKLIRLRAFIRLLRSRYNVSDQDARELMQQVTSALEHSHTRTD